MAAGATRGASPATEDDGSAADSLRPRTPSSAVTVDRSGLDPPDRIGRRTRTRRARGRRRARRGRRVAPTRARPLRRQVAVAGASAAAGSTPPPRAGCAPKREVDTCRQRPSGRRSRSCARRSRAPDVHRLRVPRPQGERDRRDPARAAQAGRDLSRRQEPPHADRRRRRRRARRLTPLLEGPTAIAFGTATRRRPPRPSSTRRVRTRIVKIKGGVLGDQPDRRRGRDPARDASAAARCSRRSWPAISRPRGHAAGLLRRAAADLAYALQQLADQKARPPARHRDAHITRRRPRTNSDPRRSSTSWRPSPRTSCSRPSTR